MPCDDGSEAGATCWPALREGNSPVVWPEGGGHVFEPRKAGPNPWRPHNPILCAARGLLTTCDYGTLAAAGQTFITLREPSEMRSETYAIAVMTTFVTLATQSSAQSAAAVRRLPLEAVPAVTIDISARARHYHDQRYYRGGFYRHILPADFYPPFALPINQCSYYGPFPLYPYCWGW